MEALTAEEIKKRLLHLRDRYAEAIKQHHRAIEALQNQLKGVDDCIILLENEVE